MDRFVTPRRRPKKSIMPGLVVTVVAAVAGLFVCVAGVLLLASHCEHKFRPTAELLEAENKVSEAAHQLVIRGEAGDRGVVFRSLADAMAAKVAGSTGYGTITITATASALKPTGTAVVPWVPSGQSTIKTASLLSSDAAPVGVSVPISTHTDLSTVYTVLSTMNSTVHLTKTRTATTTVTLPVSSESASSAVDAEICSVSVATKTVSVFITATPLPDETVTGDASTATQVNTDLSLTARLPDVTLSGQASTRTEVQTDVSLTKGLPDATVSGSPDTLTDVKTDVWVTTGLPDATVSGTPETVTDVETSALVTSEAAAEVTTIVITDLWDNVHSSHITLTATYTISSAAPTQTPAVVTVTVSDIYGPWAKPPASSSVLADAATGDAPGSGAVTTETVTLTQTGGPPATSLTTVHVTPTSNSTAAAGYPYASGGGVATSPVEVSQGGKTRGGSASLGCTIMLVAAMMLVL